MKKLPLFLALLTTAPFIPLIAAWKYFHLERRVPYAVLVGDFFIILGGAFLLNFSPNAKR